jgi:LPXTG-motif cell wall-anchored protein
MYEEEKKEEKKTFFEKNNVWILLFAFILVSVLLGFLYTARKKMKGIKTGRKMLGGGGCGCSATVPPPSS